MKIFILTTVLFLATQITIAQQPDENRKLFADRIDSVIKQKIVDSLGFDEMTAEKFIETYKADTKKIRAINKEKRLLMQSIEKDPSASDMDTKLDKIIQLESDLLEQRRSFFSELKAFLTSQQIAQTLILRKNFEKDFRKQIIRHKDNKNRRGREDLER